MIKKIFTYIFSAVLVAVFLEGFLISFILYSSVFPKGVKELDEYALSVTREIFDNELFSNEDILNYIELIDKSRRDVRLTLIENNGNVIYDTLDLQLENHANRPEFLEALKKGEGHSSRYSDTLDEKTIYVAIRLTDGSVLRFAKTEQSLLVLAGSFFPPFLTGIFVLMILSAIMAITMAKKIITPINNINLDNPELNDEAGYEELQPLLFRLLKQKAQIRSSIEALQKNQREFENITSCMSEGIVILNDKQSILSINKSALSVFDLRKEDCISHHALTLNRSEVFENFVNDVSQKKLPVDCVIPKATSWFKITANPVYSGELITGSVFLIVDITAEKNAEEIRRTFTANVSHELKTPLTSISGYAEIIRDGIAAPEDISNFASRICDESHRLLNLIEDIIKLSHLDEKTSIVANEVSIDLGKIIDDVCNRLTFPANAKKVKIIKDIQTHQLIVGNDTLLDELVYNLCDNAVKYNKNDGSVTIRVSVKDKNSIMLSVIDTGIGIPEDDIEKVFERFYRVDKSRSKETGGTGLGLAIVKHVAQYHHATVHVESKVGFGTTVEVVFSQLLNNESSSLIKEN